MSSSPKTWIVCPCYFDAPLFLKVREEAISELGVLPGGLGFLVVDDSAGLDPEIDALLAGIADVAVMRPPYNLGHQAALVFGLRRAGSRIALDDIVVTMDSDGEDRPRDLPAMIAPLLRNKARLDLVVIAQRTERTETLAFQAMYLCFKCFFRIATGTVIRSGNFASYRGWLLRDIIYHPHFDQCYSSSIISLPLNIETVPIPRGRRYRGKSKMGFWGLFTHGIRMLMPFTERIAIRGIFACSILSAVFLVFFVASCLHGGPGHRAATQIAFTGFCSSLLLLGMHAVLFTTFSQTKSHSLRVLHDHANSSERGTNA